MDDKAKLINLILQPNIICPHTAYNEVYKVIEYAMQYLTITYRKKYLSVIVLNNQKIDRFYHCVECHEHR